MGTRSLTIIHNEWNNKPICGLYRQFDGYLSGHGAELKDEFGNYQIINGIPIGKSTSNMANGMGCLAAQVISFFKTEIGGFYMVDVEDYQEYNYHLYCRDGKIWVKVTEYDDHVIFDGWLSDLPEDEE